MNMNNEEDINPFADPSIRQATAETFSKQETVNDYNPFINTTTSVKSTSSPKVNVAPVFPSIQQATSISSLTPCGDTQQTKGKFSNETARVDLSQLERQQAELEQREKRIAERERELRNCEIGHRVNNFPPIPNWFPCRPCFYQDISIEIPGEFQTWVRYLYYLWLIYSGTLALNIFAALSYFVVDRQGAATFGLSIVYFVLFAPCSYVCWFRPIYRAFRTDRASDFMLFFFIFFFQILISVFMTLGWTNSGFCGFILMIELFSAGGKKIAVGVIVMIVTLSFGVIALADGLLLVKVHRLYRQTGATLEQAQREFQSAFVNNPTVRGAAREVGTAGINDTLRNSGNQQRPVNSN